MFDFLKSLSESRLFPTAPTLSKVSDKDIAEWTLVNLCALRVLLSIEHTHDWAHVYARKTVQYGKFDRWRVDGTDLYELLQSNSEVDTGKVTLGNGLNKSNILAWLRQASRREPDEYTTRRLFVRMDYDLKIKNESLRAMRRLAMDWRHIDHHKKQLLFTRLLQYMRAKMRRSELLLQMERLARYHDLELHHDNDDDAEIVKFF